MLTNVQVVPGATSVARYDDVVVWFETGPHGGGVMLTQLLQAVQAVASGSVPPRQMGARLAAVLNTGDATAVPALVAATPDDDGGLRVVVHGWGAVVADGLRVPNGWVDQVVEGRRTFFLGRNTATPVAPVERSALDLEDGIVPGEGVSFSLAATEPASGPTAGAETPATAAPPASAPPAGESALAGPDAPAASRPPPVAWPPPGTPSVVPPARLTAPPAAPPPPSSPSGPTPVGGPAGTALGRLVLDDGSSAVLERTCVLGSAPQASPAVQTGVAVPLTVAGPGIGPVHAEIRVDEGRVAVRDLGGGPTHVLVAGAASWAPLAPGQVTPLAPGTRIALGQRTISYERP